MVNGRAGTLIHRLSFRFCDAFDRLVPMRFHRAADERLKRSIAARVADYYADSNRQLAEILGIDLQALGYEMPARTAGDLPNAPVPTTGTMRAVYAGFTEAPWSEHEPGRANVPS